MHPPSSSLPALEPLGSWACWFVPLLALVEAVPVAGVSVPGAAPIALAGVVAAAPGAVRG